MRALRPAELAWVAAAPCAALIVAAIVLGGPPLGHAFLEPQQDGLWPPDAPYVFGQAEAAKHARYLIALLGPVLLTAAVLLGSARRMPRMRPAVARAVVLVTQTATGAFLVLAVLGQSNLVDPGPTRLWPIFGWRTYAAAALLTAGTLALLRRGGVAARLRRAARETRALKAACACVAGLLIGAWVLTAVTTDQAVGTSGSMDWTLDDPFAILNGLAPLVDFRPVYGHLSPYPIALLLQLLGTSIFVYSILLSAFSGLVLLAIYALLRRVARSSALGLALFLPFLAIGFLLIEQDPGFAASNATLFSIWPLRFAGPYLLAWLTARHLDGAAPRRAWALLLAAGLTTIDDPSFGGSALVATLIALAAAQGWPSRPALARLAGNAAAGLLAAVALVALLALAWSGQLPQLATTLEFPRIFGVLGLAAMPMPTLGFHLVVYVTFAAALGVAAVRIVAGSGDRLLTAMLAWSGAFGLLAGGYFLGRSEVGKLVALFSPWGLSLSLLTLVVVRALAARGWRRPGLAELMVLFGFAVAACALREVPAPWTQVERIGRTDHLTAELVPPPALREQLEPHEKVALLLPLGHRIAHQLDVRDVSPYAGFEMVVTRAQLQAVLDAMRTERAHTLFVEAPALVPAHRQALAEAGYVERGAAEGISMWSDSTPP